MSGFNWLRLHYLWLSLVVLVVDQVTKWLAVAKLMSSAPVVLMPFLNFNLAFNRGAAFSFLNDASGWQNTFFMAFSAIICAALIVWLLRLSFSDRCSGLGVALIVGGALGNVTDRLHYGFVVDFIDAHAGGYHWPTFNVADSAITVGAIFLLIASCRKSDDR